MTTNQYLRFQSYAWMLSVLMLGANMAVSEPAFGFSTNVKFPFVPIHEFITDVSLRSTQGKLSNGDSVYFSDLAIKEISENNIWVDKLSADVSREHFDDETLISGSRSLVDLREVLIGDLSRSPTQDFVWLYIGWMLHPIQDFYSHSNWINVTAPGTINSYFGFGDHPEFEDRSGIGDTCDSDASKLLPQFREGPELPKKITTGYFFGFPTWTYKSIIGRGLQQKQKCLHGQRPAGVPPLLAGGIHKDIPEADIAEFADARTRAIDASRALVQGILDQFEGNDRALCALTGSNHALCTRTQFPPVIGPNPNPDPNPDPDPDPDPDPLQFSGAASASVISGFTCDDGANSDEEVISGRKNASASADIGCSSERSPTVTWTYNGNASASYDIFTSPTGMSGGLYAFATGSKSPFNSSGGNAFTSISVQAEIRTLVASCYEAEAYLTGSKSSSRAGIRSSISVFNAKAEVNLNRSLERLEDTDTETKIGLVSAGKIGVNMAVTGSQAGAGETIEMYGNFKISFFPPNPDGTCG